MTSPVVGITASELDRILAQVFTDREDRETANRWLPAILFAALAGAAWTAAQIRAVPILGTEDRALRAFLATQRGWIALVNATTRDRVRTAVLAAVEAEQPVTEAVRDLFARMEEKRAPSLALQHAGAAWEAGSTREMTLQVVPARLWVTQRDMRVRPSHFTLDGQCRAPDEPFETAAGELLRYPRDPEAELDETINCRCFTAPLARGCDQKARHLDTETKRAAYWKAANASLAVEESRMIRAIRNTLRNQRNALLTALPRTEGTE